MYALMLAQVNQTYQDQRLHRKVSKEKKKSSTI